MIARPFVDATTGLNSALIVASPGNFGGSITVADRLHLGGAEANVLRNLMYCDQVKLSMVGGLRFIDVDEQTGHRFDQHAAERGRSAQPHHQQHCRPFPRRKPVRRRPARSGNRTPPRTIFVDLTGKIAAGNMHEVLNIAGSTTQNIGTSTNTFEGGLLALATNIGHYTRNEFAYAPEGTIKFGFQWTQRISTYIGVNGLYLSRVLRPGEQIDPVVNTTLVPVSTQFGNVFGPLRPQAPIKQGDMAIGGGMIGLSIRY